MAGRRCAPKQAPPAFFKEGTCIKPTQRPRRLTKDTARTNETARPPGPVPHLCAVPSLEPRYKHATLHISGYLVSSVLRFRPMMGHRVLRRSKGALGRESQSHHTAPWVCGCVEGERPERAINDKNHSVRCRDWRIVSWSGGVVRPWRCMRP